MPSSSKLKKIKCNLEILVQSYFQTSTEIVMPTFLPMKARVIDQSLNESIVMSYYLLPPGNYHKLADVFYFYISNDRLPLANQKPNTNYIASQVECLECRNSKSSCQKLHCFKCEYLSFYTVYELETLRTYCYSPSLRTGKVLNKSVR